MSDKDIFLLDTNTILYLIKGDENVLQLTEGKIVSLNFVTEIELLGWRLLTPELHDILLDLINNVQYFDYSYRIKQSTISLRQIYNLKLGDAFIAATALEHDLTLISANKSFAKVEELRLINFVPTL